MKFANFVPLVSLPNVITGAGSYITGGGELATVEEASKKQDFGCRGAYATGQAEGWHRSGRLFASRETNNDIVRVV